MTALRLILLLVVTANSFATNVYKEVVVHDVNFEDEISPRLMTCADGVFSHFVTPTRISISPSFWIGNFNNDDVSFEDWSQGCDRYQSLLHPVNDTAWHTHGNRKIVEVYEMYYEGKCYKRLEERVLVQLNEFPQLQFRGVAFFYIGLVDSQFCAP